MKSGKRYLFHFVILSFALFTNTTFADVILPHIFSDNMVMQQNISLPIWGWAEPEETVTVEFLGQKVETKADALGNWKLTLAAVKAGGPHEMKITGKNVIELKNILIGEVWVCSGQSNMEMGLGAGVFGGQEEIESADYKEIRLFSIPRATSGIPNPDINAKWKICNSQGINESGIWGGFSAVGYFFGKNLYENLNVPIGLIQAAWGGTRIEPWTPAESFCKNQKLEDICKQLKQADNIYRKNLSSDLTRMQRWIEQSQKYLESNSPVPIMPVYSCHPLTDCEHPENPAILYNGMINPIVPFGIRGVIWYQGCANICDGSIYMEKMKTLIGGWREAWAERDFPFYYTQLAPFRYGPSPVPNRLPQIWEAQFATLSIPNTGMAVTVDLVDNIEDIHPRNKKDVGRRLALWALAKTYGKDIVYSGPLYKSMEIEGNKIRINFDYADGGLDSKDGKPLNWFEIAASDRKFFKADTIIDDNTIVVSNPQIKNPVAVRFAWNQEAQPNLINKGKLPASPFRTDKW